jgi:hypothetical protein
MEAGGKTRVGPANIHGNGLMANSDLDLKDGYIGVTHVDNCPINDMGKNYNHSETPNARVTKIGNRHHIVPIDRIANGEEITVDYRLQKDLEQPQEGWMNGESIKELQNGGTTTAPEFTLNESTAAGRVGLEPGSEEFKNAPRFVRKGNKSFHYNPSNELNVMGTDREADPRYKRTLGDMMYDVFHPRKDPRISMSFQQGGSILGAMQSSMRAGTRAPYSAGNEPQKKVEDQGKWRENPDGSWTQMSDDYVAPVKPDSPLVTFHKQKTAEETKSRNEAEAERVRRSSMSSRERFIEDSKARTESRQLSTPVAASESTGVHNLPAQVDPGPRLKDIDIVAEQQNYQRAVESEFRRNAPWIREKYGDEALYGEDGNYDWGKIGSLMSDENYSQGIEDMKYGEYLRAEQKAYDEAPWYMKTANFVSAGLSDPVLTLQHFMFEGQGPQYGQYKMLNEEGANSRFARRATNYDDSWVNQGVNMINPFHYLGDANLAVGRGDYKAATIDLANAALLGRMGPGAGATTVPGQATMKATSPYLRTLPSGFKSVLKRESSVGDLCRRSDLARFSDDAGIASMESTIASKADDASDFMWRSSLQGSPDALKYAQQFKGPVRSVSKPMTQAAANEYKLSNLANSLNKPGITNVERASIEDALTKSIPSKTEVLSNPVFRESYMSQSISTRKKIDQLLDNPEGYWKTDIFKNNPAVQEVLGSRSFYSPNEYLLPRVPGSAYGHSTPEMLMAPIINKGVLSQERNILNQLGTRAGTRTIGDQAAEYKKGGTIYNLMCK